MIKTEESIWELLRCRFRCQADKEKLKAIRGKALSAGIRGMCGSGLYGCGQCCQNYEDYIAKAAGAGEEELTYLGIGICGSKTGQPASGSLPH